MLINWEREKNKGHTIETLLPLLYKEFQDLTRRQSGAGSATITVVTGSGGSSGGGGSAVATEYRADAFTVAGSGTATISYSDAMSSTSYRAFVWMRDSSGILTQIDENGITKSTSGMSFAVNEAGTGFYLVIADT